VLVGLANHAELAGKYAGQVRAGALGAREPLASLLGGNDGEPFFQPGQQ
jgi:hypothetical protein